MSIQDQSDLSYPETAFSLAKMWASVAGKLHQTRLVQTFLNSGPVQAWQKNQHEKAEAARLRQLEIGERRREHCRATAEGSLLYTIENACPQNLAFLCRIKYESPVDAEYIAVIDALLEEKGVRFKVFEVPGHPNSVQVSLVSAETQNGFSAAYCSVKIVRPALLEPVDIIQVPVHSVPGEALG